MNNIVAHLKTSKHKRNTSDKKYSNKGGEELLTQLHNVRQYNTEIIGDTRMNSSHLICIQFKQAPMKFFCQGIH